MVRYLFAAIIISLLGCAPTAVEIISDNNQISTPYYSIMVPPNEGWFQYQDEPTTGRVYDEENYQIGFVDICDTPYPEMIAAARRVGVRMYEIRAGE